MKISRIFLCKMFFVNLYEIAYFMLSRKTQTCNESPPKKVKISEYIGKYKFYRKVFQTKVVGFKKIYSLILSIFLDDVTLSSHIDF